MKLIKELQDTCTTQEIISVCEDLQKEGHRVVIEHQNDRIRVYEESDWDEIDWTDESGSIAFREHEKKIEVEKLRALYHHLANDAPPGDSPHWGEYEATMRYLEAELRELGVEL